MSQDGAERQKALGGGAWAKIRARWMARYSGACGMCSRPTAKPHLDHNHETQVIRGLICPKCNLALGLMETPGLLAAAYNYLRRTDTLPDEWKHIARKAQPSELGPSQQDLIEIEFWER